MRKIDSIATIEAPLLETNSGAHTSAIEFGVNVRKGGLLQSQILLRGVTQRVLVAKAGSSSNPSHLFISALKYYFRYLPCRDIHLMAQQGPKQVLEGPHRFH
jgi:hypothetical protein